MPMSKLQSRAFDRALGDRDALRAALEQIAPFVDPHPSWRRVEYRDRAQAALKMLRELGLIGEGRPDA